MNIKKMDEKGFTLIEMIAVIVLMGITAALAGMWIVSVANAYLYSKLNMDTTQKAQLAMTRVTKELTAIKTVNAGAAAQLTYTRSNYDYVNMMDPGDLTQTLKYDAAGGTLTINGNILTDNVSNFTMSYCDEVNSTNCPTNWSSTSRIIQITLTLKGADNTVSAFTQRIAPRNIL